MTQADAIDATRRRFLRLAGATGTVVVLGAGPAGAAAKQHAKGSEEEVSPSEDLMREHGVLDRALLIYEACLVRGGEKDASMLPVVAKTGDLIRRFIEAYHEKLEEQFVFPRFEAAGTLVDLVSTLRTQHQSGRALTDEILRAAEGGDPTAMAEGGRMSGPMRAFIRMYRPHAAREDTVLFPAFRQLVKQHEYEALGDQFEDQEHALFGKAGFEGIVAQVAELERTIGIYDLNQFTPS